MLIAPIVPPSTSLDELIECLRGTARTTATTTVKDIAYGMCTVGAAGRIHDRALLDALDWPPTIRLGIRCVYDGVLLVTRAEHGIAEVSTNRYFRVPFRQRRRAELHIGDKVLLVAHLTPGHLAIYPPRALHAFFGNHQRLLEA
ncbi:hypothetical protein ACFTS5_10840 [Nocardia sp. NPDC056952]|uniref:hypothetical protein n=1 Tax=Nocardia sp. NPDC056952 TaxID=3345979 RepID=UPI00363A3B61